jgi:integrase
VSVLTDWMLRHRPDPKRYPGAKRLPYVFVSEDGNALSMSAVKDMFRLLRERVSGLTPGLCAHLLRHTWNDRFSKMTAENGVKEARAAKLREELMGWKKGSKMAEHYSRRSIEEDAARVSLELHDTSARGLAQ